ncbi:TonB-dependent receptor [Sphingomonas sp. Y38-1Y]|uniref:TonB-dependent receptor n=1 Tax=Sphingomonas sp. Y38-1Y TaxID=3078265 RepID=UPI0028F14A00|nr:TonB-dependent receptor [Sphingomonas sp. Y38-1Y]
MKRIAGGMVAVAVLAMMPAARADAQALDLPAGTLGQQVTTLGRQARISIVVPDATLWKRRVPALRGSMTPEAALAEIARRAGARVERIGAVGWRLTPAPKPEPRPRVRPVARPTPPVPTPTTPTDIVVTASKRDTTRDHFAGQFASVSGEELERGGAGGTDRLVQRLTSVTSTYLGAGRNKLFIRGIADSSFTGPTQATVGQYYGDLRLSYNAPDPDLRLTDLAAVEVLEGPQGTLYGAGSLGGLIRLVPNAVDLNALTGTATLGTSATTHGRPSYDLQGVVNLPILGDRVALRVVGGHSVEGGYIDKPLLGRRDVNRTEIDSGRATLHVELGGAWSAELIGIGQRIRGADSQYADRFGEPLTRSAPVVEGFSADYAQGQVVVSGEVAGIKIRSTTGITAHDLVERYDATPPGGPDRLFEQSNRTRMQANETRAWQTARDGSGWLAGISYIHNRSRLLRLIGTPDQRTPTTGVDNGVTEWTVYGEGSLRPVRPLLATVGLRATRSMLSGRAVDVLAINRTAALAEAEAERAQTIVLPAASLLFDASPRLKLFARYQEGFRPGGLAIEGESVRQFRNDRVRTIEAGARYTAPLFDLRLTGARAAWRNIQADFIDGSGLPSTANIGNGDLWTVEAAAGVRPIEGLRVEGALSLNDGRIDEPSTSLIALADRTSSEPGAQSARAVALARLAQIPNIAGITTRLGAIYQAPVGRGDLTIDGWARYIGSSRLGVGPVLGQRQGSYMDTEATARFAIGGVGISATVSNILDTRGNRFALGTPFTTGRDQVTPLRPRTFRIGIDAAF